MVRLTENGGKTDVETVGKDRQINSRSRDDRTNIVDGKWIKKLVE